MLSLADLKSGESAIVSSIHAMERHVRNSFYAIGVTPGVLVKLMRRGRQGEIFQFEIRGSQIVMRAEEACSISISRPFDDSERLPACG